MASSYAAFRRRLTAYLDAFSPQRRRREQLHKDTRAVAISTADMPHIRQNQRNADRAAAAAEIIRTNSRRGDVNDEALVQLPAGRKSGQVNQDELGEPSTSRKKRKSLDDTETQAPTVASSSRRKRSTANIDEPAASGNDSPPRRKKRRAVQEDAEEKVEQVTPRRRKRKVIHDDDSDTAAEAQAQQGGGEQPVPNARPCAGLRGTGQPDPPEQPKTVREVTEVSIPSPRMQRKGRQSTSAAGTGFPECPPDAIVYQVVYTQDGSTADAGDDQSGRPDFETRMEVLGVFNNLDQANKLAHSTAKKWLREKQEQGTTFQRIECAEEAWEKTVQSLNDNDLVVVMFGRGKEQRYCCATQDETYGERRIVVQAATVQGETGNTEAGASQETDDSQIPTPPKSSPDQASSDASSEPRRLTTGNNEFVLNPKKPMFIYNVYRKMVNHGSGEDEYRNFGAFVDQAEANELCFKMAKKAHPQLAPENDDEEEEMEVQEAKELWPTPQRVGAMEAFKTKRGEMIYAVEEEHGRYTDWWAVERMKLQ